MLVPYERRCFSQAREYTKCCRLYEYYSLKICVRNSVCPFVRLNSELCWRRSTTGVTITRLARFTGADNSPTLLEKLLPDSLYAPQTHHQRRSKILCKETRRLSELQLAYCALKNRNYEGYPESKFRWAIKKKKNKNMLQTMYIAIWCTHCTLLST